MFSASYDTHGASGGPDQFSECLPVSLQATWRPEQHLETSEVKVKAVSSKMLCALCEV